MSSEPLTHLLAEWAELEPARCETDGTWWYVRRWDAMRRVNMIARMDYDRVFGAVTEAAEAKGWYVDWDYAMRWAAVYRVEGEVSVEVGSGIDNNPAVAALEAYVWALETNPEATDE